MNSMHDKTAVCLVANLNTYIKIFQECINKLEMLENIMVKF